MASVSDAATALIRAAIHDGRLRPGERLKEGELARRLRISRTPVREALRQLKIEGLVASAPNRGSVVQSYDADELTDIYELRLHLEGHAARRAATVATPECVEALRSSCDRFGELRRRGRAAVADLVAENARFHGLVLDACGSASLLAAVRRTIEMPLLYRAYHYYDDAQFEAAEAHHRRLAAALAAGDPERAEVVMRAHILDARDVVLAHLPPCAICR
ncbi:MAG TPA: GntR family transcriptional regulator [Solirubrobacter sp.]|nr:GntR family transcriptional regulator [Solirubrobacter sp.]